MKTAVKPPEKIEIYYRTSKNKTSSLMARLHRLAFDPWRVASRRFGRLQLEFDKSSWQG